MNLHGYPFMLALITATVGALFLIGWNQKRAIEQAGLTVTSWFRTPFKNEDVGGVVNSKHQYFMAADVVPANAATVATLRRLGFKKILNEGTHIHVEFI